MLTMTESPRVVSAHRDVPAAAATIFELIADPTQQPRWDGNDNLGAAPSGQRLHAVGDVFTMGLTTGAVRENHVVEFEEGRLIAWRPSEPGAEPPGHLWRWRLEPIDGANTRVTHTYDWSQLTDEKRLERAKATTPERLQASVDRLTALVETTNAEKNFRQVIRLEDLGTDLAATHRALPVDEPAADTEALLAALDEHGFVVLPELLDAAGCEAIRNAVEPLLGPMGRNAFEGNRTQRVYSVLDKTRALDTVVEHPAVLKILDRLLMPNYLLSQLQVINISPGEQAQLAHPDDGFYPIPRPRQVLSIATIWAIDEFTTTNGATVVIPGSHRWGDDRVPQPSDERQPVEMPAGSCVLFVGALWHGGGANRHDRPRMAVTAQYCQPWLRPQEAFSLSTSRDTVRTLSPKLQAMLGYSIHPPFMGSVDGMHPLRLLD
jgi:ectoine hydroxylase-related dioxygenase (phytanoyl-CoA dioxygenase family)/uncharacterized protein YndB with AHSA1/START domain